MIIENVAASFPSRKVSNQEVVDLVDLYSTEFVGDKPRMLRVVNTLLDRCGLTSRNWRSGNERPIDHVAAAVTSALEGTELRPADIDLFIYVGVGGGFREPGNSYMVAKTLGIHAAECFDIVDACMSWTRGLAVASSLFKTGDFRNAMIVNAEFNLSEGTAGWPQNYNVRNLQELEHLLPSYTIGEAATATLLLPSAADNVSITFHSKPVLADLCMIAVSGYQGYFDMKPALAQFGEGRFIAHGAKLHDQLAEEIPFLIRKSKINMADNDIVFTHSSSTAAWDKVGKEHGFADKIFHIYPQTGNVVSASIPAAMALAKRAGKLVKGHRVAFLMGSAGMSFAASRFIY